MQMPIENAKPKSHKITSRSILLSLLLIPLNTYWIAITEMVWSSLHFTSASLPLNVIFILLFIMLFNWILGFLFPKSVLTQSELLTIYIILAISSAISGYDSIVALMGVLPHAHWYDTPENDWKSLFHPYIPKWLVVSDREAVKPFYRGGENFYYLEYIDAWLPAIISWSIFIAVLFLIMLMLSVILRKPWTESEKLSYPIIQVPLEMTNPMTQLFKNKRMWIGLALAASVSLINGLNYLYPAIPYIPTRGISLNQYFTEKPWAPSGRLDIRFTPFIIGLTFLLPLDLTFSCWFFFVFRVAFRIFGNAVGWGNIPDFPFWGEQSLGGLIGLACIAVWSTKKHLWSAFKGCFTKPMENDSNEPIRYRIAVISLILLSLSLYLFCAQMGMSLWVFMLFFTLFFAMSIALTRIRVELGIPEHPFFFVTPQETMITLLGTRIYGPRNLTILSILIWLTRRKRSHPMPHQLEAFKIAERADMNSRGVMWLMILGCMAGIVAAFAIFPYTLYKYGAEARATGMMGIGHDAFGNLTSWLSNPRSTDYVGSGFTFGSLGFTLFLAAMRRQFIWWPFHPAGFPLGTGDAIDDYWFSMVVVTFIKLAVLKHGGARSYRRAIPLFLGLVLGEYVVGCGWAILGVLVGKPMYIVWV